MAARLQNVSSCSGRFLFLARPWILFCLFLFLPRFAAAQAPPWTVARITGDDISVSGAGGDVSPQDPRIIYLASGSEITVHSGQARIELVNKGVIGVCGPAKMKLLESGGAFTVAMDFGRLHISLDDATPMSVYTPFVLVVPEGIGGGPREATISLDANAAMCARATHGGVRMQQQFTGETVVVPMPEELFVNGGQLHGVSGTPGSCQCEILQARAAPSVVPAAPRQQTTVNAPPVRHPQPPANRPAAVVSREYSAPAKATEPSPAEKKVAVNQPATQTPVWKVLMPPLTFDASSPNPPSIPSPETILLVREVRVEPDWVFHGRVAPRGSPAARHASVQSVALSTPPARDAAALQKTSKKNDSPKHHGLLWRIFVGEKRCAGTGCGT